MPRSRAPLIAAVAAVLTLAGCGGSAEPGAKADPVSAVSPGSVPGATSATVIEGGAVATAAAAASTPAASAAASSAASLTTSGTSAAAAKAVHFGNPSGRAAVPAAARAVNTTTVAHVIGTGSPAGCTSAAVVKAVAAGGITRFNCGPKPVTIRMTSTAKVVNAHPDVVLDGGGLVTLSGSGKRRILYQNTCDQAQGWTTNHCNDQAHPRLTVQNLTFSAGNATGQTTDGGGGGAIFVRGGRLTVVNSRFVENACDRTGPDLGGAAIRALDQSGGQPVYIVSSTFEHGTCSNGSALSSIGVSWVILNSLFSHNTAVGSGANPARGGTPGGGSGGAIYTDGDTYTVTVSGSKIVSNTANEGGGAIFFVSNDHTGSLTITGSTLSANRSKGFETQGYPGIFYLGKGSHPVVSSSHLS